MYQDVNHIPAYMFVREIAVQTAVHSDNIVIAAVTHCY